MPGSCVVKGISGSVWVGFHKAADLTGWTYTKGRVTATVSNVNQFWGRQRATELRLMVGRREWRWRNGAVDAEAGSGSYRVSGPPEGA